MPPELSSLEGGASPHEQTGCVVPRPAHVGLTDCSWFHSCALDQLDTSVAGFVSFFLSAAVEQQKVGMT